MDLREALREEHSKRNSLRIARYIGDDKDRFKELMKLFLANEDIVTQRSGMVLSECADKYPHLIKPYVAKLTDNLYKENLHDAVKRNTLRIFQFTEIPERSQGKLFDICMKFVLSMNEAIAIKAFAVTVLYTISLKHPELQSELKLIVSDLAKHATDPALKSRYNRVVKDLLKQEK
ncbi:MAG: hypothetical protein K0S33_1295 [Bacteroidetes bacterium]|jgi:hypothetical protein|nr:hypothetical protein [Bacteroidota bacterium]